MLVLDQSDKVVKHVVELFFKHCELLLSFARIVVNHTLDIGPDDSLTFFMESAALIEML